MTQTCSDHNDQNQPFDLFRGGVSLNLHENSAKIFLFELEVPSSSQIGIASVHQYATYDYVFHKP